MPVKFQIYPDRDLVVARFFGFVTHREALASAKDYASDPTARPGQNQIIDLSGVTEIEHDFVSFLAMMAALPDHLLPPGEEPMIVYLAPHPLAREIVSLVERSFAGMNGPKTMMAESLTAALEILGLPQDSLARR